MFKLRRITGVMVVASATLLAGSAFAFGGGQTGFTGRNGGQNSCLACHGSQTFDGATINIGAGETTNCSPNDGSADFEIPLISVGTTVPVTVNLAAPATPPACPQVNCCEDPAVAQEGDACLSRPGSNRNCSPATASACCQPGLEVCGDVVAGFDLEVVGAGVLDIPGSRQACEVVGDCPDGETCRQSVCVASDVRFEGDNVQELTHTFAKVATTGAQWTVNYVAPATLDAAAEGPSFFLGANVANGNGFDDNLDLNGNFQTSAGLTDGDAFVMPGGCLVCPSGKPAVNGSCCACVSANPGSSVAFTGGIAALLGFFVLGGRRRKRS